MRYLLDTHVFLWSLFADEKLSSRARAVISDVSQVIAVSTITYWEIALKYALGKLELEGVTPDELPRYATAMGMISCSPSAEDAATFYQLPKDIHKDPFDRLIVWLAIRNEMTLISKDKHVADYQAYGLKVVW